METNDGIQEAARKELLRRAAKKELERRKAAKTQAQPSPSLGEYGMDMLRGAGTGLVKGVSSLAGTIGDAKQMSGDVLGWGAGKLGFSPDVQDMARTAGKAITFPGFATAPTSEQLQGTVEGFTGPLQEAQMLPGQIVQRIGEFAPSAIGGGGTFLRKAAMVGVPAVASELAGRIPGIEGSDYQPYVEMGVGLAAGLPIASGGKGNAMKEMRDKAPSLASVKEEKDAAYKAVDQAKIVYDPNAYKGAAMKIKYGLADKGWDKLQGGEIAGLVNRVDAILKPNAVPSWTKVDGILKDAKQIMRSSADETTKMRARIFVDNLEGLVKSDNFKSRGGMSKVQVKETIDTARENARRVILAREIETMKRRLPGYLSGDESAFRNQFGAYLKSPESATLTPAERAAFSKVVRREGPLNVAHNMGSRWGQIAGGSTGSVIGGLAGSVFGPLGTAAGAVAGGAVNVATQTGFRKLMDKITEKAVDDAMKTVLAGKKASGEAMSKQAQETLRAQIRAALTAEAASTPARENWFLQDANGATYNPPR